MNEKLYPTREIVINFSFTFSLRDLSNMKMKKEKNNGINKNLP